MTNWMQLTATSTVTEEVPCVFQCTGKISRKIYTVVHSFTVCMHACVNNIASYIYYPPQVVGPRSKYPGS